MRNTKKGFTLVELIVVITILAILGTIAFISLGSYTADARNAKRLDGISKLATAIDNDQLSGKSLLAYVTANTANNSFGTVVNVAGTGSILTAGSTKNYEAGDINPTALNVKADQFKDPLGSNPLYKAGVSTKAGGVYELAAKLEDGSSSIAAVKGNFSPRAASTKTIGTGSTADTSVTLSTATDINFFKVGDLTSIGGSSTGFTITKISPDGTGITLSPSLGASESGSTTIALANAESSSLITASGITNSTDGFVVNDSTTIFPY